MFALYTQSDQLFKEIYGLHFDVNKLITMKHPDDTKRKSHVH